MTILQLLKANISVFINFNVVVSINVLRVYLYHL